MRQLITNVRTAQIKAIAATSDTCTVKLGYGESSVTSVCTFVFTLRAYSSLARLAQDIEGPYDLELLRYSEESPELVNDVIVITAPTN